MHAPAQTPPDWFVLGLQILNGDLSYARGYAVQWETFFDQLGPIARRMPLMTVIGNHERDWPGTGDRFGMAYDSGGECGVPYQLRTGMPAAGPDRPWYAFDYGPIHFLQYSTGRLLLFCVYR